MAQHKYVIRGLAQETDCDWCGMPLYHGDEAIETDTGGIACSRRCADRYDDQAEERSRLGREVA